MLKQLNHLYCSISKNKRGDRFLTDSAITKAILSTQIVFFTFYRKSKEINFCFKETFVIFFLTFFSQVINNYFFQQIATLKQ